MRCTKALLVCSAVAVSVAFSACSPSASSSSTSSPGSADVLRVAEEALPTSFDWQSTTGKRTQIFAIQVYQTLYAVDETYTPLPGLAQAMPTVSADGLDYTIPLRTDVTFHDGTPMKAADVVASLKRWGKISGNGKAMFEHVADLSAPSDSEIRIKLSSPFDVVRFLALPVGAAAIMPAKIAQAAGTEAITDIKKIVGTGPYKLTEFLKGQRYVLEKFDQFQAAKNGARSGLASAAPATYKRVEVNSVADPTTRSQSTIAGQYDVALNVPGTLLDQVKSASNVSANIVSPFYSEWMMLNTTRPPFDNIQIRRAAALALDRKDLAASVFGTPEMYDVNNGVYSKGMGILSSDAGEQGTAQDLPQAKALLKAGGYNKEPVVILTSKDYGQNLHDGSVAVAQQLTAAGFNVKIDEVDGATADARWVKPDGWDILVDNLGIGYISPTGHLLFNGNEAFPEWYGLKGPIRVQLNRWHTAKSEEQRKEVMDAIQTQFQKDVPAVKLADFSQLEAVGKNLNLGDQGFYWPTWWSAKPK